MTKCNICRSEFQRRSMTHKCCSVECAEIYGREQARKESAKNARAETKARKEKLKTNSDLANDAQKEVNKYVNLRDFHTPCICCGKSPYIGVRHAGHFKSRGANSFLKFNLWNINSCCYSCNVMKSGNIGEYRPNLIAKLGIEKVAFLEAAPRSRKYDKEYLLRLKAIFAKKAARQKKKLLLSTN